MHEFRRAGVFGLVWLAVGLGCAYAAGGEEKPSKPKTVTIPLDQIWALDMPGTRDIHEIVKVDTKHVPPRPSVLDRIVRSLLFRQHKQMSGYAVPGKPNRNLIWASKALWKRRRCQFNILFPGEFLPRPTVVGSARRLRDPH